MSHLWTAAEAVSQIPRIQQRARELPFWEWALEAGLRIDRETFSYEAFPYLLPIYKSFPDDDEDLFRFMLVIMKAAQMGGTVIFLLWIIYQALRRPMNIGYYLPDQGTAMKFSGTR